MHELISDRIALYYEDIPIEMSKYASMRWTVAEFWLANILFQQFREPDVHDQPTLPGKPLQVS